MFFPLRQKREKNQSVKITAKLTTQETPSMAMSMVSMDHWQWANGYMSWKITKQQMLRGFNGQGPLPEISPVPATCIPKAPETKIWIFCLLSEDL